MPKRYTVDLTPDERAHLVALTRKGKASARQVTRAHVLLHAADGLTDADIAVAAHTSVPTVARIRKRFVQGRVQEAITERYRKGGRPKLDLKQEAHLIALSCSTPPEGRKDWTMQLLADKLVELEVVDEISDETVRRTLKKKQAQAVAEATVVPRRGGSRLPLADGGHP
jgi:transposase